jgi:hypothetical protein
MVWVLTIEPTILPHRDIGLISKLEIRDLLLVNDLFIGFYYLPPYPTVVIVICFLN